MSWADVLAARERADYLYRTGNVRPAKKLLCRDDLRYLCKEVLGYTLWSDFHDKLHEWIENSTKPRKLIMVPRGHFKSSIITIGRSIQKLLRDPNKRILISNATWDNARTFLQEAKQHMAEGSALSKIYGRFDDRKCGAMWTRDKIIISGRTHPKKEPSLQSTGAEKTLTSQHYDDIILDDLVARETIGTAEQRQKTKTYYKDVLSLLDPGGEVTVIGTSWHEDDLYSELRNSADFDVYVRTAIEDGQPVFPTRFTLEYLKNLKKELGPFEFSAQYMLDPHPEENQEFNKNWIKFYDVLPPDPMYVTVTIDPSLGKNDRSDASAIVATGVTAKSMVYVLDAVQFRKKVEQIPAEVVKVVQNLIAVGKPPNVILLENFGFQQMLLEPIKQALLANNLNVYVELLPHLVKETKENRIRSLIPKFANYQILLAPKLRELSDQIMHWNSVRKIKHDDLIDALAWNVKYWYRKPAMETKVMVAPPYSIDWWMRQIHGNGSGNQHILGEWMN